MKPRIHVENVSKRFVYVPVRARQTTLKSAIVNGLFRRPERQTVEALRDVSFSLGAGELLGVVGRNGSGKTTLLRLLAGIYRSDAGSIDISGTLAPLLALGAGFHPDLTGRENARIELLVLGLSPRDIAARMEQIADFSEIGDFIDAPLRTYSAGMTARLAYAAAMSTEPDVMLIDEILAVGDEAFTAKCLAHVEGLRQQGKTIVLVTHNAALVRERCDRALWLERGRLAAFGDASEVTGAYHESLGEIPV